MEQENTAVQLLLAFSRELNGVKGNRKYTTRQLTIRGVTFRYYFTKEEIKIILKSEGEKQLGLIESLYKFEDDLEEYIKKATEGTPELKYVDWLKKNDLKIIVKKGDIFPC